MTGFTRKMRFRICAFMMILVMLAGELSIPVTAAEYESANVNDTFADVPEESIANDANLAPEISSDEETAAADVSSQEESATDISPEEKIAETASSEEPAAEIISEGEEPAAEIISDDEELSADVSSEEDLLTEESEEDVTDESELLGGTATSISVPAVQYLYEGQEVSVYDDIKYTPSDSSDGLKYTLSSSDSTVVKTNNTDNYWNSTITAQKPGVANVTYTLENGKTATSKVVVLGLYKDGVLLGKLSASNAFDLYYNPQNASQKKTAQLTLSDGTNSYKATWKSYSLNTAYIDANGLVTANNNGNIDSDSLIEATFMGKTFSTMVNVHTVIDSLFVGQRNSVLEVYDPNDGQSYHFYANDEDNISITSSPAGIVHPRFGDSSYNLSYEILEDTDYTANVLKGNKPNNFNPQNYLEFDRDFLTVKAKFHESLRDLPNNEIRVKLKLTAKTGDVTKETELTYTVKICDYWDRLYLDADINVFEGTTYLTENYMPPEYRAKGWSFVEPDLSAYNGTTHNMISVPVVRKDSAGNILQYAFINLYFISKPYLYVYADDIIPFYDDAHADKRTEGYAGTPLGYNVVFDYTFKNFFYADDDPNFEPTDDPYYSPDKIYCKWKVDVSPVGNAFSVLKPDDNFKAYYNWSGNDYNGIKEAEDNGETIKLIRAGKPGTEAVKVTLTVYEWNKPQNVITTVDQIINIKAVKVAGNGAVNCDKTDTYIANIANAATPYNNLVVSKNTSLDLSSPTMYTVGQTYALVIDSNSNYSVTAKTSDPGVLKLGAVKKTKVSINDEEDGHNTKVDKDCDVIPMTVLNSGNASIIITFNDDLKTQMTIPILGIDPDKYTDKDGNEKLNVTMPITTFTVNSQKIDGFNGTEAFIRHSFGQTGDTLSNHEIFLNKAELKKAGETPIDCDILSSLMGGDFITIKGPAGKYDLVLTYGCYTEIDNDRNINKSSYKECGTVTIPNITIKDLNKAPAVTVKQEQKLNTTFRNILKPEDDGYSIYYGMENEATAGIFNITAGPESIKKVEVFNEAGIKFTETDPENSVNRNDFSFSPETGRLFLYTNPGRKITVKVYFYEYKEPVVKDKINVGTVSSSFALSSTTGSAFTDSGQDGGFRYSDARFSVQLIDKKTKTPVKLDDYVSDLDGFKTTVYAETVSGNMENSYIVKRSGKTLLISAKDTNTAPAKTGDKIKITIRRPEWTSNQEFYYTIKGTSVAKAGLALGSKTITLYNYKNLASSTSTTFSLTGGAISDKLGNIAITEVVKKGATPVLGNTIAIRAAGGIIMVSKNSETLKAGTYNFKLEVQGWGKKNPTTTLTVKVIDIDPASTGKNGVSVKATAKGSIDVLDRGKTSVVITPKFANIPKDAQIEFRGLTGQYTNMFNVENYNDNGTYSISLIPYTVVSKKVKYTIGAKYRIYVDDNGNWFDVETPQVKVNLKQGAIKYTVSYNPYFSNNLSCENRLVDIQTTTAQGTLIRDPNIWMDDQYGFWASSQFKRTNNPADKQADGACGYYTFGLIHFSDISTRAGKSYTLKVNIKPDEAFIDSKPQTINLKVTITK